MRADIHDGSEHMLQSEAGYIDARPHQPGSTNPSCTARPDHTSGVTLGPTTMSAAGLALVSGHSSSPSAGQRGTTSRLMHRSKTALSFNHLVGSGQKRRREIEAERFGGPDIDDQFVTFRRLHR